MQLDDLFAFKLIKSLGVNYPIINEIGCAPTKLITIVVSGYQTKTVCNILENYRAAKITDFMALSNISDVLCDTNSECVLIPYSTTRKGKDILQFIKTAVQMGCVGDRKLRALPVLISETGIQGSDTENLFVMHLQGDLSSIHLSVEDVVPPDEQIEVVVDKIRDLDLAGKCAEERALLTASCFLYPHLKSEGKSREFEQLLNLASDLVIRDDNNRDPYEACELFVEELYLWQERTQFHDIYQLPNLGMNAEAKLDSIILFNDQYIYMKQQLFEQISQPLLGVFSLDVLKAALADEGIICPENGKTYTAKVGYRNIVGEYKRERMIRFRREKLSRVGEMDFIDLCIPEMGGR